jgi:poly [ADP-ribose] polymerase
MAAPKWKENKGTSGSDMLDADFPDCEVVEHRIANQTNADKNANKFFSAELQKCSNGRWRVYTNYGRVDDNEYSGAVGVYGPGIETEARAFFEKKFKSKCTASKGYQEIQFVRAKVGSPSARQRTNKVDESEIPDEKKQKLNENDDKKKSTRKLDIHPTVKRLVDQWYRESSRTITSNAAVTITSDGIETPLGVLTFSQINTGRSILGELGEALKNDDTDEVRKLTGAFYSNIPAKLGRKITDDDLINSDTLIQNKLDLLQMMEDALDVGGATFVSDAQQKFMELGIEASPLDTSDAEYKRIVSGIKKTRGHNHYGTTDKVLNILEVRLGSDRPRYESCSVGNEVELYHGSRNCNLMGLMNKGLLIAPPSAPVSGYMFDRGIYLADASTKSINYSLYSFPGMGHVNNCFLLICKAKIGKQKKLQHSDYNASKYCLGKDAKFDSVMGCKGSSLIHNEYITYTLDQVTITHVVELQR